MRVVDVDEVVIITSARIVQLLELLQAEPILIRWEFTLILAALLAD